MKKIITLAALLISAFSGMWGQQTIEAANIATFDLKAHTTLGVDLNTGASGMETAIDQLGIWFELFPYSTRGVPSKESDQVLASIRAEGSKFALKWFAAQQDAQPGQKTLSTTAPFSTEVLFDRIIAELLYKQYWLRLAGTEPSMYTNNASIKSIFDDVILDSTNSNVPIPLLSPNRNLVQLTDGKIPMTGMMSGGANFEKLKFNLRAGSKGTWATNEENAWIFGGDVAVTPVEKMTFTLSGLGAMNYDETSPGTNPLAYGAGVDYLVSFTDKVALRPFAGFDGIYETVSEKATWEAGGGVFLYWKGTEYKVTHDEIHRWNKEFPVGLSLSANIDNEQMINVMFSLFEETRSDALIPNLGGFIEVEAVNLSAVLAQDSAFASAAQIEYLVLKKFKPYIFEKYVQGYKAGKLTDIDMLTSRVGILIMPVKRFTLDIRYERNDSIGAEIDLDNGVLTSCFKMKL